MYLPPRIWVNDRVQLTGPMGVSAFAFQIPSSGESTPSFPRPFFQLWPFAMMEPHLHILYDRRSELACLEPGRPFHLPMKIVGHSLLPNGFSQCVNNLLADLAPTEMFEHHHPGQNYGGRVDHILVRVFWSGAMRGFKHGGSISDIGSWSHSQAAYLRRRCVRKIVTVQVWSRENRVLIRANQDLLEDRIGDAVFY